MNTWRAVITNYSVGVGEGVTKMVTVGIGVGSGFTGTSASPGFIVGAPRTTATTPRVEKFVYRSTVAICAMEPAESSTEVTYIPLARQEQMVDLQRFPATAIYRPL